jgi:hypothetical protein
MYITSMLLNVQRYALLAYLPLYARIEESNRNEKQLNILN